jgi:pimeloyl-ACP methyl ester carboxylesterase
VDAPNPFIPVFWGDLARPQESIEQVLPYTHWLSGSSPSDDEGQAETRRTRARRKALGAVYRTVRERYLIAAGRFAGDIILYQRRQAEIQARVWETVIREAPGWGTDDAPVHVITHSLGGSVAFDMAVAALPRLHIDSLVTCACTAPYFHVIGCSPEPLSHHPPGEPVILPPSVSRWMNYFIPLDPWGYLTAPVFRLHDGSAPLDVEVHSGERGDRLMRHGASHYWRHTAVISGVRQALGVAADDADESSI